MEWGSIQSRKASVAQRRALHRLGLSDHLIRKMDVTDAARAIKALIELRERLSLGLTAAAGSQKREPLKTPSPVRSMEPS